MIFSLLLLLQPLRAEVVSGIEVDVTASSSGEARDKAIEEAHLKAYQELKKRKDNLPSVDSVYDMVDSFSVSDEKVSSTRYRAVFTFHFNDNPLKNTPLLDEKNPAVIKETLYQTKVYVASLEEWQKVKKAFGGPFKGGIYSSAVIEATFASPFDPAMLSKRLEEAGFSLQQKQTLWIIKKK